MSSETDHERSTARPGLRSRLRPDVLLLLAVAYIPLLLSDRGQIGADTKPYLYLDPGRLLDGASSMWLPDVGLGTVPHQNIGYLWPMGPYYWVMETLGLPDWVAQRLWIGSIIVAAGLGVRYLLRVLGWRGVGVTVAMFAYAMSPYTLSYVARISALLLPWAGLPWLVGLTIQAYRTKGWRHPALFALVAATIGSTNATSILLIGIAPVLWLLHEAAEKRSLRSIIGPSLRIGVLTAATGLWWVVGVRTQGSFGPPVLRFTETVEAVADSSTAPEVLRGLGYWFFYGNDHLGEWIEPSRAFTARTVVLILSFAIPIAALCAATITRFKQRSYFLALIVLGTLISVGPHPYDAPSILGRVFKAFTRSDAGLALRSTPRATPLVVLGMAVLLGAGADALSKWRPKVERPLAIVAVGVLLANMAPLFNGQMIATYLQRPENIPEYWTEAIADLDAAGPSSRIMEVPGSDFSSYRWGNTIEPITPGLTDRPYIARELVPFGSEPSASLILAIDKMFQEGQYDTDAMAPLARLMSIGDIVLRADLIYERFRTPRPVITWSDLLATPGLAAPVGYGPRTPNVAGPEQPLIDEVSLALDPSIEHPPRVARFPVDDPLPIVRARPIPFSQLISGDAASLIDLASLDLLDVDQAVHFTGALAAEPALQRQIVDAGAALILTDGNRRTARRWGTIRENSGFIEQADETALNYDATDYRLNVFPDADVSAQTVARQIGATVQATDYGNPVSYTPDDRPAGALDGDPDTSWRVGAFANVNGERLIIDLASPVPLDQIQLIQPLIGFRNRWITEVRIHHAGGHTDVTLNDSSRTAQGQTVGLTAPQSGRIELEVLATNFGKRPRYNGLSSVGFAEVTIPGVAFDETIVLPTDLFTQVDNDLDHPLTISLSRTRSDPQEPVRFDPEEALDREFSLPSGRPFTLLGEARLSAYVDDALIDDLVRARSDGGVVAQSSERLAGDHPSRARSAVDNDPATAWQTPFDLVTEQWLELTTAQPTELSTITFDLVADGRHSVPELLTLTVDGGSPIPLEFPAIADGASPMHVETVTIALPTAVVGTSFRLDIDRIRPVITKDWYSGNGIAMPVGIAEIREFALATPLPDLFDSECRNDLLTVNGETVEVRVTGTMTDALERQPLAVELCGATMLDLPAGTSRLEAGRGRDTGIDLDRLALVSPRQGLVPESAAIEAPQVDVATEERTSIDLSVTAATEPFFLVLGQSHNVGWHATVDGIGDLGEPILIDGFANGWLIDPATTGPAFDVALRWTPQRTVNLALWFSLFAAIACLLLAAAGRAAATSAVEHAEFIGREPAARASSRPVGWLIAIGATAAFAFVNLPRWQWLALPLAAAMWIAGRVPRLLPALAALCLIIAGGFTTIEQYRNRYPPDFGWPQFFEPIHVVGVLCVLLLAAEAVRGLLRPDADDLPPD